MARPCSSSVRILLVLFALGLLPHLGQAAMLRLSLAQLAQQADTIVLGTVIRQVSAWNAQYTAIYTDVTLAVEQVIAGTPGAEVTFRPVSLEGAESLYRQRAAALRQWLTRLEVSVAGEGGAP